MKLDYLIENPDNPQTTTDEKMARLVGKLRRVPEGLAAIRIAYITDDPRFAGRGMVLSGNKRLRALKEIYGEGGEVPDEWFRDITAMTGEQRKEFIIDANTGEGEWDIDRLLAQYETETLNLLADDELQKAIAEYAEQSEDEYGEEFSLPNREELEEHNLEVHCTAAEMATIMRVQKTIKARYPELETGGAALAKVCEIWEEQEKLS